MTFREALSSHRLMAGTFVKTPHPHVIEVLALSDLDVLVLDAEHAPFDRSALDVAILAARAGNKPVLVRTASPSAEALMQALDCGADGVIVPHIRSAAEAAEAVRLCHYGPGGRGFAGSTRAARYTTAGMAKHRQNARNVVVIAQIEDREALDELDAIAAVPGLDALFVGRADLAISLGAESSDDRLVDEATALVCDAARNQGMPLGMFLANPGDVGRWRERGASLFILQSDQEFILKGAAALGALIRA